MPKLKKGHVGRYVVLPEQLDKWLEKQAAKSGLRSVQQCLVNIASEAKKAESQRAAQPAEAAA